jgi:hypothetical protein
MAKRKSTAFNDTQIKNGRIVKLRKDGTIKADMGPYKQGPVFKQPKAHINNV